MAVFEPSNEWQFVPENVAIPGGLEVRLDLEEGGRWARLLQDNGKEDQNLVERFTEPAPYTNDLATVALDPEQLEVMREKAHDHDDGADIARLHGLSLLNLFKDASNPAHDQAGRILGVCMRNNHDATKAIVTACPELSQALKFDRRSLSIVGSLVSNSKGREYLQSHGTLDKVRRGLVTADHIDSATSKAISNLMQDLAIAGEDSADLCKWVDALQQAYYTTQNAELKQLAIDIVQHNGEFESLTVECRPQPGLLLPHEEQKRAEESARRFENRLASRNHFDEL